jgi:putative ABC transport system ATP-binding protein
VTALEPPPTTSALAILDGVREYGRDESRIRALDGVSLSIATGSWAAVMGPSGSGKSTLLHCLAGLDRLTSGRIWLGEQEITNASDDQLTRLRRIEIGFIFQNFNLISALTARQNVALPLRLAGRNPTKAEIQRALASVGLADRANHRPGQLSGGQQQRVAIARALITKPRVLFADEPTGALDSQSARVVLDLMRSMVGAGQTILMVTHDPVAASRADGVVFLRDGRIVDKWGPRTASDVAERLATLEH